MMTLLYAILIVAHVVGAAIMIACMMYSSEQNQQAEFEESLDRLREVTI